MLVLYTSSIPATIDLETVCVATNRLVLYTSSIPATIDLETVCAATNRLVLYTSSIPATIDLETVCVATNRLVYIHNSAYRSKWRSEISTIKMTIPFVTEVPKWDVQLMLNKQIGTDFTIKSVNADFLMISVPVNAREGYRHTLSISAVPSPPAVQGIQLLNPLSPPPTPSIPSLPFPSFPPIEKQLNPGPEFPSRPSFDPPSRIIELEVDLLVSSQSPELSDLSPPTCRVEKDNWASVCKPEPTRCQDRIWEVRLILQDAESGLVWLDLSDSGVFWERMNWRLGSLEPGWLEWKGSCCTSFLGISSKNIGGLEGSCSAGDQEKYLQSLQSVSWTVLVVIIVFLVISLLIATVIIFYIRRKRKAQLEEMRQFPQPR
ncbi:uncharacterized protein LOC111699399 [Eurytemora carolleeae]|uniref:uncharacterized protein LOC111699399 n=1 Tax=Eurytemora carolleeae TaxID=1294199 RepID=UPI000C78CB89|nr:uncharacterized protein LOC111699399 [Eurytemora carolleeae]|eukprot:XP_023325841.1 uncharacterized protein LOC111699399 [Eurytemora affinis]